MDALNAQVLQLKRQQQPSFGSSANHSIEAMKDTATDVKAAISNAVKDTGSVLAPAVQTVISAPATQAGVEDLIQLLTSVQSLNRTAKGRAAVASAIARLHAVLGPSGNDMQSMNAAVAVARTQDPTLGALFSHVDSKNLGAAAMLLALNELRSDLDRQQPFDSDLAVVMKFSADDPELKKALLRLAPYAANGVLSRATLQDQFSGLAGDIVAAKVAGQPASVQERALQRLNDLVKVRKADDITGTSTDAKVARAELMLAKGDVQGAISEVQTLQGASAAVAAPWLQQAQGTVAGTQSADILSQSILQVLSQSASSGGFSMDGIMGTLKNAFDAEKQVEQEENARALALSFSLDAGAINAEGAVVFAPGFPAGGYCRLDRGASRQNQYRVDGIQDRDLRRLRGGRIVRFDAALYPILPVCGARSCPCRASTSVIKSRSTTSAAIMT